MADRQFAKSFMYNKNKAVKGLSLGECSIFMNGFPININEQNTFDCDRSIKTEPFILAQ